MFYDALLFMKKHDILYQFQSKCNRIVKNTVGAWGILIL